MEFLKKRVITNNNYSSFNFWIFWRIIKKNINWKPVVKLGQLKSSKVTLDLSGLVRGQLGQLVVTTWLSEPLRTSINMNLSVSEPHFVLQISQPPNIAQKWFCIKNLHMDLSFQEIKTIWKSDTWLLRYEAKTKSHFFWDALYVANFFLTLLVWARVVKGVRGGVSRSERLVK